MDNSRALGLSLGKSLCACASLRACVLVCVFFVRKHIQTVYMCIYSSIYISVVATIRQIVDVYNIILILLTVVELSLLMYICVSQTCVFSPTFTIHGQLFQKRR